MNEGHREHLVTCVALRLSGTGKHSEFLREPLTAYLQKMDDRTLRAVTMLSELVPENKAWSEEQAVVRSLVLGNEDNEYRDIRTLANHIRDIENRDITLDHLHLLFSTLRYLELLDEEDEEYPHLLCHAKLMQYQYRDDIPYHHNEELVLLVHENHDRHEEIVNLMYREGIKEVGLLKEHLRNKAPALRDGIL